MNKTIIININGQVFHIEEDAYEVIRTYMTEVKRHFAYSPDSDEIVTDIENRLAEMFAERLLQEHKQVIVLQDVREVTAQMGSVSDFGTDDDAEGFATGPRKVHKKLYRDIDDRVIGGVCSGIGHYFDIEARWIRVLFLLIVFLGGAGIMAYVILWIVMPKADTRAEKMAMKGEPINIHNFKKNFDEEVEALRHNFNHAATEARPALQKLGSFVRDLVSHFAAFFGGAAKILVKLLGVFIVLVGGMVLLGLIVALFTALGFWHDELDVFPLSAINPEYRGILFVSAFLLIFIPLIALVLFAVRVVFNRQIVTKSASFAMLILWIIGLSCGIFYGTRVASEFNEEASLTQTTDLKASPVYYLKLNGAKFLSHDDSVRYNLNSKS
ncbi:MAG TPA: PspC domain-containing protein, partial [Sphingobacteriaceae bacterium]